MEVVVLTVWWVPLSSQLWCLVSLDTGTSNMQIQLNVAAFFIFFSLTSGYLELVFNQDCELLF